MVVSNLTRTETRERRSQLAVHAYRVELEPNADDRGMFGPNGTYDASIPVVCGQLHAQG